MKRLLVGIDGSDCGDRALKVAARQARAADAELLICYVISWSPYTFATPEENAERHRRREEELQAAQTKLLKPRVAELSSAGLRVESLARHGHPVKTLVRLADEREADVIVVGRSGDTSLKARIFGGTAAGLVQSASVPVLVVP
jgi:nucleotide-binding universal stress UspA family protein